MHVSEDCVEANLPEIANEELQGLFVQRSPRIGYRPLRYHVRIEEHKHVEK